MDFSFMDIPTARIRRPQALDTASGVVSKSKKKLQ
jgi:hypothetical protein